MFRENEDWRNRWGHRNLRQWKMQSSDLPPAKRNLVPVKQILQFKLQLLRQL